MIILHPHLLISMVLSISIYFHLSFIRIQGAYCPIICNTSRSGDTRTAAGQDNGEGGGGRHQLSSHCWGGSHYTHRPTHLPLKTFPCMFFCLSFLLIAYSCVCYMSLPGSWGWVGVCMSHVRERGRREEPERSQDPLLEIWAVSRERGGQGQIL